MRGAGPNCTVCPRIMADLCTCTYCTSRRWLPHTQGITLVAHLDTLAAPVPAVDARRAHEMPHRCSTRSRAVQKLQKPVKLRDFTLIGILTRGGVKGQLTQPYRRIGTKFTCTIQIFGTEERGGKDEVKKGKCRVGRYLQTVIDVEA